MNTAPSSAVYDPTFTAAEIHRMRIIEDLATAREEAIREKDPALLNAVAEQYEARGAKFCAADLRRRAKKRIRIIEHKTTFNHNRVAEEQEEQIIEAMRTLPHGSRHFQDIRRAAKINTSTLEKLMRNMRLSGKIAYDTCGNYRVTDMDQLL